MPARPPGLPTTEPRRPPAEEHVFPARPVLLAAFPKQVALPLPRSGANVGRAWLEAAGIADVKVSGDHLRFTQMGGRLYVEDVGSRNGTHLDGHELTALERVALDDGAVLRLGRTLLVYREAFEGPLAPEPPLGRLVGPWGLGDVRRALKRLPLHPAQSALNVLVEGDAGTGKELVAYEIARILGRDSRYMAVNVTGIPHALFEAHLFGWEKGAFTGSAGSNRGVFRVSSGGAVFLDEIEELPAELQPKLLRFLQQREVFPLGATDLTYVDVVVIAATSRSTRGTSLKDAFRRDLFARFQVTLKLPPLSARAEDVFAIFEALWQPLYGPLDLEKTRVDVEAVDLMMRFGWPSNVRELQRLVAAVDPSVGLKLSTVQQVLGVERDGAASKTPPPTRQAIADALAASGGVKSQAAKLLQISRPQLLRLLKKHERE